jgi:predicted transcriptional regulator
MVIQEFPDSFTNLVDMATRLNDNFRKREAKRKGMLRPTKYYNLNKK